ncbi:MAG TPA: hypothetical protein VIU34_22475 [Steroidobacter sp.]
MTFPRLFLVAAGLLLVSCAMPDRSERSAAYFVQAGRVLQHPRCLNCHPKERQPTQGEDLHAHVPMLQATETGHGEPALQCNVCHQKANFSTHLESIRSIPGHPHWALAPRSMAWQGASLREICEQIKDPSRNGGRSLEAIHEHVANDSLVGWAWQPGDGRKPAPGTQREFGELIDAWIQTGAACPSS